MDEMDEMVLSNQEKSEFFTEKYNDVDTDGLESDPTCFKFVEAGFFTGDSDIVDECEAMDEGKREDKRISQNIGALKNTPNHLLHGNLMNLMYESTFRAMNDFNNSGGGTSSGGGSCLISGGGEIDKDSIEKLNSRELTGVIESIERLLDSKKEKEDMKDEAKAADIRNQEESRAEASREAAMKRQEEKAKEGVEEKAKEEDVETIEPFTNMNNSFMNIFYIMLIMLVLFTFFKKACNKNIKNK